MASIPPLSLWSRHRPPLHVRDQVREAYVAQQRKDANAAFRARLREQYRIVVENGLEISGS